MRTFLPDRQQHMTSSTVIVKSQITKWMAGQFVSTCGECEVNVRMWVVTGFPGSYSWVSGNLRAFGWSQTPPNSPLSRCLGLLHQLPEKVKTKTFIMKEEPVWGRIKGCRLRDNSHIVQMPGYTGRTPHTDYYSFSPYTEQWWHSEKAKLPVTRCHLGLY